MKNPASFSIIMLAGKSSRIQWCQVDLSKSRTQISTRISILDKKFTNHTFDFILDKVNSKLSSWQAYMLSMAGRVTFPKSILQALPTYVMQSTILPSSTCEANNKKMLSLCVGGTRRFLRKSILQLGTSCVNQNELVGWV